MSDTATTLTALQSALDDIRQVTPNGTGKRIIIDLQEQLGFLADEVDHKRCGHKDKDFGCGDWLPMGELDEDGFCKYCTRKHAEAAADDEINAEFYAHGRNRN